MWWFGGPISMPMPPVVVPSTDASMMQAQMEANFRQLGYHLGIPGRILEMNADELAGFLARARTGELWGEEAQA